MRVYNQELHCLIQGKRDVSFVVRKGFITRERSQFGLEKNLGYFQYICVIMGSNKNARLRRLILIPLYLKSS